MHRQDALFTLSHAEAGLSQVREVFSKGGYGDNFVGSLYDGPHKFDLEMQAEAFEFFDGQTRRWHGFSARMTESPRKVWSSRDWKRSERRLMHGLPS